MKKKLVIGLMASLLIITLIAAPILSVDFTTPSHAQLDMSFRGNIPPNIAANQLTKEDAERFPFVWWRDTTAQNALWAYSVTQWPNTIISAYTGADCAVLVFAGQPGANVVAIIGPTGNTIIGCGGSRNAAKIALGAFAQAVPNFQLNLRGIIFTDCNAQTVWGAAEFVGVGIERTAPVLVYGSANILDAGAQRQAVSTAVVQHNLYAFAPELPYGPDGNLGVGSAFAFNPYQPNNGMVVPNRFISAETTVSLGGVSITLTPGCAEDGGLWVYLPVQKVLIAGEIFGKYFPPIDGITCPEIPVTKWINTLNAWIIKDANVLASLHALPITNAADVEDVLTNQKNALTSVHTQTVQKINAMMTLDDIVASVKIHDSIKSHPWVQEFNGTVAGAVKSIYHQYMGWFDWEVDSLTNFSRIEEAAFLVDLAGGSARALQEAYECEQDHTLAGAQKALLISDALRKVSPSHEADLIYIQSLKKIGYAQTSGQMRNYYLLLAKRAEAAMN